VLGQGQSAGTGSECWDRVRVLGQGQSAGIGLQIFECVGWDFMY